MARPVIALLTDFGLRDHYVAAMKGVILGICPDAVLIDITHDIPPQDVLAGALELEAVAPYLPTGTVVVAVVDPGVGTSRRALAVEAGPLRLVGPDNGLLGLAVAHAPEHRAVALLNPARAREPISRTFEGRDRFAPAAAWLALGVDLADFGPAVSNLVSCHVPDASKVADGVDGVVLRVDHFGNLITNIPVEMLRSRGAGLTIQIASGVVSGVVRAYDEAPAGALCALVESTGRLEIAVNGGSAATRLAVGRGAAVRVRGRSGA